MQRLFLHLRLLIILIFGSPFISLDLDLSVWMTSKWTNEMRGHLNSLWRLDCLPKFQAIAQEQGHISISEGFWEESHFEIEDHLIGNHDQYGETFMFTSGHHGQSLGYDFDDGEVAAEGHKGRSSQRAVMILVFLATGITRFMRLEDGCNVVT